MLSASQLGRFLAFSVIGTVTLMPLLVLPAMVGVLVDNAGMSDSSAGWSASLNFLASSIVGLLISLRVHRLNLRRVATIALAIGIVGDLVSAFTAGESTLFFFARFATGLAIGAAYVVSVASFSRFEHFERGFGLFVTLQFIVSGLGLYVVPVYADQMGATGLYSMFAVLDLIALFLTRFLPTGRSSAPEPAATGSELRILLTVSAVFAIIGFALFEAANNAQFTYIERFGVSLNISDQQIGFSLLIASLVGIPGAFAIVIVGSRFGTLGPLTLGIAIAVAGLSILISANNYFWYFFGSCCMGFSWAFCLPFIQSLLANIDRNGSAIAAGTSLSTFGSAFGPGLAAIVVVGGNYANVFWLSIGLFAATIAAFFIASRGTRRVQRSLGP